MKKRKKMSVADFEEAVWTLDGVRIVIRSPTDSEIGAYDYERAAVETRRVSQFLENRINPKVGDHDFVVIQGDGEQPHGSVILRTLRSSYQN